MKKVSLFFLLLVSQASFGARSFNGSTQWFKATGTAPYPAIAHYPISFSAWIYTTNDANQQAILGIGDKDTSTVWYLINAAMNVANNSAYAHRRNTTAYSSAKTGLVVNEWHHIVGVYASASSMLVYLDGVGGTESTDSVTLSSAIDNICIGKVADNTAAGAYKFLGNICEAAIWNCALAQADIDLLSNAGDPNGAYAPGLVQEPNLIGWWKLAESNADDSAVDEQGNYTLTDYGSPGIADHPAGIVYTLGGQSVVPVIMNSYRQRRN